MSSKRDDTASALPVEATAQERAGDEPDNRGEPGDSMSSALFGDHEQSWHVMAMRLEHVIDHHIESQAPIFLKIDIEGGEYELLPGLAALLARPHVTALVSLHPQFLLEHLIETAKPSAIGARFASAHDDVLRSLPWSGRTRFAERGLRRLGGRGSHR